MAVSRIVARLSAASAAALVCVSAGLAPAGAADELATFGDEDLAACVRDALGLAPGAGIPVEALASLTSLDCTTSTYGSLAGLEHATSLTSLTVGEVMDHLSTWDSVISLEPLAGLTALESLHLSGDGGDLIGWESLGGLTRLREVELGISESVAGPLAVTLGWLAGASELTRLVVNQSTVTDLSALTGKPLTELRLRHTNPDSFAPIATLEHLEVLDLGDTGVTDASFLAGLTALTTLDLERNAITDVAPLAGLTALTDLDLAYNRVRDLSPLGPLAPSTTLDARHQSPPAATVAICVPHTLTLPVAIDGSTVPLSTASVDPVLGVLDGDRATWVRPDDAISLSFRDATGRFTGQITETTGPGTWGECAWEFVPKPALSGAGAVGSTLTVDPGTWMPTVTSMGAYEWYRDGKRIWGGVSGTSYTVTEYDVDKDITVVARGTRSGFVPTTATSNAVTVRRAFDRAPSPTITGSPTVGKVLTVTAGRWSPQPQGFTYQWYRGGKPIAGATERTYTPRASDAGRPIAARVTAVRFGYSTTYRTANAGRIGLALTTSAPRITGTPAVDSTVRAATGAWGPGAVTVTMLWYVNGNLRHTGRAYTPGPRDAFARLQLKVTGERGGYTTVTRYGGGATIAGLRYKNCAALWKDYPGGVLRTSTTKNKVKGVVAHGITRDAFVSAPLYHLNSARDADGDGWACER